MKTIEERAKEFAQNFNIVPKGIDCGNCNTCTKCKEYNRFVDIVTEQRDNDIEKACEIVRNIANEYFGDWEQSCKVEDTFRKAMEE